MDTMILRFSPNHNDSMITLWSRCRKDPVNKITWGYPTPARDDVETPTAAKTGATSLCPQELGGMWAAVSVGRENGSPAPPGWSGPSVVQCGSTGW